MVIAKTAVIAGAIVDNPTRDNRIVDGVAPIAIANSAKDKQQI